MSVIKFDSIDTTAKTVKMSVDGVLVTRKIADNVTDTDKYIEALAQGLAIEYAEKPTLKATTYKKGDTVIDSTPEPEVISK